MPSFNLGLNQKSIGANRPVPAVSINLGNTRGKGSSTRMYNFCKQHSQAPSLCINQFIKVSGGSGNNPTPPTPPITKGWADVGGGVGSFDNVNALVSIPSKSGGDLIFVGGYFLTVGPSNLISNYFAIYDTGADSWTTFGTAFNAAVNALAFDENTGCIYIGGGFTQIGTLACNHIAVYDLNFFSTLGRPPSSGVGNGVLPYVDDIVIDGNNVYVGGQFDNAGVIPNVNNIAVYNTQSQTWAGLGTGLSFGISGGIGPGVTSMALDGTKLYVGGGFTTAGTISANNIAVYDTGANSWSALGAGVGGDINSVAINGSKLYIGGLFTSAGTILSGLNNLVVYDTTSTSWTNIGNVTGDNGSGFTSVETINIDNTGNVYIGGAFTTIAAGSITTSANNIAKYSSGTWSNLGNGITYPGSTLSYSVKVISSYILNPSPVYVGGSFNTAGTVSVNNLAVWKP